MEALNNAILDILSQSAYRRKGFADFGAFAAWLHRWTSHVVLRAKHRELVVHEPSARRVRPCPRCRSHDVGPLSPDGWAVLVCWHCNHQYSSHPITTPFKTGATSPMKFVGTIDRRAQGIVELTEEEVTRFGKLSRLEKPLSDDSKKYLKSWSKRDVREEFRSAMRRHRHQGEPGTAYAAGCWERRAAYTIAPPRDGVVWTATLEQLEPMEQSCSRPLLTEAPEARGLIRAWECQNPKAYARNLANFPNISYCEYPLRWRAPKERIHFEQRLTAHCDDLFAYWEKVAPKERYSSGGVRNPQQSDRGWAVAARTIREAVTDHLVFEQLFPETLLPERLARIDHGIAEVKNQRARLEEKIEDLRASHRVAKKRWARAPDRQRFAAANAHLVTLTRQLNKQNTQVWKLKMTLTDLNRCRQDVAQSAVTQVRTDDESLKISATCNEGGSRKVTIRVEEERTESKK
jgi:hypothetical protein